MHDHRRITIRRHSTETFTGNVTITDDFVDGLQSVGISQRLSLENATIIDNFANEFRPLAFHREWWKCHNHRRLGRQIIVRRHLSIVHNYRQIHRWTV
jgi:hypothetical protein